MKKYGYPFYIVLFIFLLDKISLPENVRKYGRCESTPLENIKDSMDLIYEKRKLLTNKKTAIMIGSSRSEVFRKINLEEIKNNKYLLKKEKDSLLNWDIEARATVKSSEFLYHYFLLYSLLKSNYKPDLIIMEVSSETINFNNPFHARIHYKLNILPYEILVQLFFVAESSWKKEIAIDLLFPSGYYKFKPELAIKNYILGKDYQTDNLVPLTLATFTEAEKQSGHGEDFPENNFSKSAFESRIIGYSKYIKEEAFLKDFHFSESEYKLFLMILDLVEKSKISTVFWRPRVHSYYGKIQKEVGLEIVDKKIEEAITKKGFKFVDMQKEHLQCNYYTDSSHMSGRCAPEMVSRIIEHSVPEK